MKRDHNAQMLLSVGSLLSSERERKGIAIEKAAKETRMRGQLLRDLENDDLSQFSSPSYARMFIIAYAKYLDLPMERVYEHLPERGSANAEAYNYISATERDLPLLRSDIAGRTRRRNKLLPVLATLAIAAILTGAGILGTYLWVNLPRLTEPVRDFGSPANADAPQLPLKSAEEELAGDPGETILTAVDEQTFGESVSIVQAPAPVQEDLPAAEGGSFDSLAPGSQTSETTPSEAALEDRAFLLETSESRAPSAEPGPSPAP